MTLRTLLSGFALALLVSPALAGRAVASGASSERSTARFEIRFMKRTIEHHMMGVEMAEMCVAKATTAPPAADDTLRTLCAEIATAQAAEADQLMSWLRDWYGVDFDPSTSGGAMRGLKRLTGEDFDVAISEMFIKHHLAQVKSSTTCLVRADHVELQKLCQKTVDVQSSEILVFRDILRQHGQID